MSLRERNPHYADVIRWGALALYAEGKVRSFFGARDPITVGELRKRRVPPSSRFWAVLRDEAGPAPLMHELALLLAEQAVEQEGRNAPVDFRIRRLLRAKGRWNAGEIGDAELSAARRRVEEAAQELASGGEPRARFLARIAIEAANSDGRRAFRQVFHNLTGSGGRAK